MSKNELGKSKVYSFRTNEELYNQFQKAVFDLPIKINAAKYLENYMKYIIEISEDYRKGQPIKIGFVTNKKNVVFFDMKDKQSYIEFEE